MAKVKLNPVLEQIRGKVGDLVFRRRAEGLVVSRNPGRSGLVPSAGQEAVRERFRLAALYGKAVYADPAEKEVYLAAARKTGASAFALAVSDFLHAPAVDEIDLTAYTGLAGQAIVVRASDDFGVTGGCPWCSVLATAHWWSKALRPLNVALGATPRRWRPRWASPWWSRSPRRTALATRPWSL